MRGKGLKFVAALATSMTLVLVAGVLAAVEAIDLPGNGVTPSAWAFDPKTSRWERLPDMAFARRAGGVAAANGRVYAMGAATARD